MTLNFFSIGYILNNCTTYKYESPPLPESKIHLQYYGYTGTGGSTYHKLKSKNGLWRGGFHLVEILTMYI